MKEAPIHSKAVSSLARFAFSEEQLSFAHNELSRVTDWRAWVNEVEVNGLSGIVSKHVSEQGLTVPKPVAIQLKALNLRHRQAAEARFEAWSEMHDAFLDAGIPYVALKGAALMPYLYKDAMLRPMRDMDFLLPESHLLQSADVLRGLGFKLSDDQPSKFMRDMHQLPNATKRVNGFLISIELHRDGISREVPGHYYFPTNETFF